VPEPLGGDGGGGGFVYDFAVEEMDGAFGVVGVARVVGDHADGGAGGVDVLEEIHDGIAIFGVEVSGGLISEENHGIANERACHRDALLLPTGKLRGIMLRAMRHLDAFEGVLDFFLALGGGHAAIGEREFDVFVDGEIADEIEGLKDETDFPIANAGALGELETGDGLAVEGVVPFRGRVEQAKDREEAGFATAGGTGDGEVFSLFDFEIDIVQGVGFEFVGEEDFADALEIDQGVVG
jgi:hypothetical protein